MSSSEHPVETPETAALARRLRRMERHLLRINVALVSLIVLIVLSAVFVVRWAGSPEAGQYRGKRFGFPHHGTVEGTRFVLVDTLGAERGKFEVNEYGIVQFWLGSDERDQPGVGMGLLPGGGSQFIVKGRSGGVRALLMADGLRFFADDSTDHKGNMGPPTVAMFPMEWPNGSTSIMLKDSTGHMLFLPPPPSRLER